MTDTTPDELIPDTVVCNLTAEIFSFPNQTPPILEVMPSGGNGQLSYLWSVGDTTPQIEPTQDSLIYSVTVTDELGCIAEATFDDMSPSDNCDFFTVEIITIDSIAPGEIKAIPNLGTAPYLYIWSEGSTSQQINVPPPGTFSVTVTDSEGCTAEDEINL